MINYVIVACLLLFSHIQLFAWKSNFANSSDATVETQYDRMHISISTCSLLIVMAPISLVLCLSSPCGLVKLLRRIPFPHYTEIDFPRLLCSILVAILCRSTKVQTFVTNIFQVRFVI